MIRKSWSSVGIVALTMAILSPPATAKALIVGIGTYGDLGARLPGIGVDIENGRAAAERLGMAPDDIKIMEDADASLARLKAALHGWLAVGVEPEEPILVYVSGYGSIVDGEPILLTYGSGRTSGGQITNGLALAELDEALGRLPAQRVYLVLDVGFAGTSQGSVPLGARRLGVSEGMSKFLPGAPAAVSDGFEWRAPNLVVLEAGHGGAMATERGSLLTLAVRDALDRARGEARSVDARWLRDTAQSYAEEKIGGQPPMDFSLRGNGTLASRALPVADAEGDGPEWTFYRDLATSGRALRISGPSEVMNVDERLEIEVDVPVDGYLNVITVDATDSAVALFPNKYHRDNKVAKGKFRLPTESMSFDIMAQPPMGRSLVVVLLTAVPIDAYDLTTASRDQEGMVQDVFASLAGNATRAFRVVSREARAQQADSVSDNQLALFYGGILEFYVRDGGEADGLTASVATFIPLSGGE